MVIVRIYKMVDGKKKYVSRMFTRDKHCDDKIRVNLTPYKAYAMVFKTTEEIVQFQVLIAYHNHGLKPDGLILEREEVDKTFVEEYGEDPLGNETRVELMNMLAKKDHYEKLIKDVDLNLKEVEAINLDELTDEAKNEVLEVIEGLKKQRDIYIATLQRIMED
jgi:hypothetical protein